MVKTAEQRHHNQRLLNKYSKLVSERRKEWLTLGRVFKQNPFNCGNPKCGVCGKDSKGKNKSKKKYNLDRYYEQNLQI